MSVRTDSKPLEESQSVGPSSAGPSEWNRRLTGEKLVLMDATQHIHDGLFAEEDDSDGVDHCGSQFVLREKNHIRLAWSIVVCILLGYTATAFLYRFVFCTFHIGIDGPAEIGKDDAGWKVIDLTVDVLFWVDLIITFFLTYKDSKDREVDSLRMIARNYLCFYFWINLLACLPEEAFTSIILAGQSGFNSDNTTSSTINLKITRVYRLQRISRLARLARVTRLMKLAHLMSQSEIWKWFQALRGVRVVNFIVGMLWAVHLMACGWYLCAALHTDWTQTWVARRAVNVSGTSLLEQGPFEQWLVAMYFVLTVFTTVGFGDISAGTEAEIFYVAFTMLVGAVVHGIIISEVIGIVTSTDEVQRVIDKQVALIDAYTAHAHMNADTAKEMKTEIAWRAKHWATSYGFDKNEMKELLTGKYMPRWLLSKMPKSIFDGALLRNNFLRCATNVPARLPCLLAVHLIACDFLNGEVVYQMGDYSFNLFLVLSGTFAFVGRPSPTGGQDAMQVDEMKPQLHVAHTSTFGEAVATVSSMIISGTNNNKSDQLYPYRLFSRQSYFGETEMIMGKPRFSTARCERKGVGLTLHKSDFLDIKEMFPQFGDLWVSAMRRRERFRKMARACLTKPTTYKVLSVTRIQEFWRGQKLPAEQRRANSRFTQVAIANQELHRRFEGDADSISSLRQEMESLRMEIRQLVTEQRKSRGVPDQGGTASATPVVCPHEFRV